MANVKRVNTSLVLENHLVTVRTKSNRRKRDGAQKELSKANLKFDRSRLYRYICLKAVSKLTRKLMGPEEPNDRPRGLGSQDRGVKLS